MPTLVVQQGAQVEVALLSTFYQDYQANSASEKDLRYERVACIRPDCYLLSTSRLSLQPVTGGTALEEIKNQLQQLQLAEV